MTVSFHKYGDFFPGTGDLRDVGVKAGKKLYTAFKIDKSMQSQKSQIAKVYRIYKNSNNIYALLCIFFLIIM